MMQVQAVNSVGRSRPSRQSYPAITLRESKYTTQYRSWFGYIAHLSQQWGGGYFTCSSDFYLPSRRQRGGVSTLWRNNAFTALHHTISVYIFFKDDVTVIHLLGISIMVWLISSPEFESRFYSCSRLYSIPYTALEFGKSNCKYYTTWTPADAKNMLKVE